MRRLSVWAIVLALFPASANATWFEARTDHFVLTINDTQENARAFAEKLERFDAALRRLYGVQDNPDQHLRPLAVYALDNGLFQKVCNCEGLLGYYQARVAQSVIFTTHMTAADKKMKIGEWSSQALLLHEYSHHFTFSNFPIAYPKWFSEGFAEFNATAEFAPDGSVLIGYPADYRADAIHNGRVSVWDLFDADSSGISWADFDGFYGKAWLLTHYLMLSHKRDGQLAHYLDIINAGKSGRDAAKLAFADLAALNTELFEYSKHGLAPRLKVPPAAQSLNIRVRELSAGEAAMLPTYAQVRSGAPKDSGPRLALEAENVARRYPNDAAVQSECAEIEFRTDRAAKALEAADAALRLNPELIEPLVMKGMIAVDLLQKSGGKDQAAWDAARGWFLNANRINPNAVMPLYEYYASFVSEGVTPTENAVNALRRAEVLAPESSIIRAALARQMLLAGDGKSARMLLAPLAYSPHATDAKDVPLQLIKMIDAGNLGEATKLIADKTKEDAAKAN